MRTVHLLNLPANNRDFRMRYNTDEGFDITLKTLGVEIIIYEPKKEDQAKKAIKTIFIPYTNIVGIEETPDIKQLVAKAE